MKFTVVIFGCQMNYADTARIKSVLQNCHRTYVETVDEADVVIFDTCSVRQKSEDKVTGKLLEIGKDKKVRITGCMIQHNLRNTVVKRKTKGKVVKGLMGVGNFVGTVQTIDPDVIGLSNIELEEFRPKPGLEDNIVYINHAFNPMFHRINKSWENVELFFRIDDTGFLPLMMKKIGYEVSYDGELTNEYNSIIPTGAVNMSGAGNNKSAFIPISTGCNQFCAFCIVPYARGMEKHLPVDHIVAEAKHHIDNGIQEITLLGQIVNKHPQFVEILEKILALPGNLRRLRYTSPYPNRYSDALLSLHENEPRLCPHIHIPLQSGSTAVLKKMFRGYNREQFMEFIDKIRALKRPISITTDIIVGFCDETEEDFKDSLSLTEYARPDMIYIGIYSTRPGTYADRKYEDNIDKKTKHDRRNRLNELLKTISYDNNQQEIGKETVAMITTQKELPDGTIEWSGYTENMKTIIVTSSKVLDISTSLINSTKQLTTPKIGEFVKVKIIGADKFVLQGEVI